MQKKQLKTQEKKDLMLKNYKLYFLNQKEQLILKYRHEHNSAYFWSTIKKDDLVRLKSWLHLSAKNSQVIILVGKY